MHQEGIRLSLATLVLVFDSNNTELCVNILTCLTACGALSVFQSFSICLSTSTNVYFSLFHSLPSSSCQLVQPFFSWNIQNLNFQSIFEFFYRPLSVTPSSFSWQIRNKFNKVTKSKAMKFNLCSNVYSIYLDSYFGWKSGHIQNLTSEVRIQSSAKFYKAHIYC